MSFANLARNSTRCNRLRVSRRNCVHCTTLTFTFAKYWNVVVEFCTEVISKPLNRFRMFEVAATIFRPTSPTNHNRPIAKILNFCVFHPILMKFGTGVVRCLVFLNIYSMERIQI